MVLRRLLRLWSVNAQPGPPPQVGVGVPRCAIPTFDHGLRILPRPSFCTRQRSYPLLKRGNVQPTLEKNKYRVLFFFSWPDLALVLAATCLSIHMDLHMYAQRTASFFLEQQQCGSALFVSECARLCTNIATEVPRRQQWPCCSRRCTDRSASHAPTAAARELTSMVLFQLSCSRQARRTG